MARGGNARIAFDEPLGRMPVLQFCKPIELRVDPTYQRDIASEGSQALIRKLAVKWNWDLCQPLVVARRRDFVDRLFVIDGQHRLAAAKLRGDIPALPCVIVDYDSTEAEAASFVTLNQQRRPLSKLDLFKAAVASGDAEAVAVARTMAEAGLTIAPHGNPISWKPGMVSNIGGLQASYRVLGPKVAARAMAALATAWPGQVLQYAGTIYPGLVAVMADEVKLPGFDDARFAKFVSWAGSKQQTEWRKLIGRTRGDNPGLNLSSASADTFRREWRKHLGAGAPPRLRFKANPDGKAWCDQCDMAVSEKDATNCKSRFCSLKVPA
jgi:hypothetical protein